MTAASREREREVRSSDCDALEIKCTDQRLTITMQRVRAGELAHAEARAMQAALAAIQGVGDAGAPSAEPSVIQTTQTLSIASGVIDRDALGAALRSLTTDAGAPLCEETSLTISRQVTHGLATELREALEFDLGLSAPMTDSLNRATDGGEARRAGSGPARRRCPLR